VKLRKLVSMRETLESRAYFGGLLPGDTWRAWRILLIAIVGEELTDQERILFRSLTDREREPLEPAAEFWGVMGRRGGKSRAMAVLAAYIAACVDHRHVLAPGERGLLPILAVSTAQGATAFNFIAGVFDTAPNLKGLVESRTADTLRLASGVDIEVRPASYRTIRGVTAVGAICDELAYWRGDDCANPDKEILKALRPSLATTGGLLACISSPYAKRGELYSTFKRHYGADGRPSILVAKAPSRTMNPSLPKRVVDRAFEEDPEAAAAEYGAEFRSDIEQFVSREAIEACLSIGVRARAPLSDISYVGFCDPSGGTTDAMAMATAHREGDVVVLDCLAERKPPFSPDSVCREFAETFGAYDVTRVAGDRYGGEWPREAFGRYGIEYQPCTKTKSELFSALLPLINSRRVDLLDDRALIGQLVNLERRVGWGGRDSIDHGPGAHDDRINAAAGALVCLNDRPLMKQKGFFDLIVCDLRKRAETAAELNRDCARPPDRQP
jgi:hypothetical protein